MLARKWASGEVTYDTLSRQQFRLLQDFWAGALLQCVKDSMQHTNSLERYCKHPVIQLK